MPVNVLPSEEAGPLQDRDLHLLDPGLTTQSDQLGPLTRG